MPDEAPDGEDDRWLCEVCGTAHSTRVAACERCGATALVPETGIDEGGAAVEYACPECGRRHHTNNPPCSDCGAMGLEPAPADTDPAAGPTPDEVGAGRVLGLSRRELLAYSVGGLGLAGLGWYAVTNRPDQGPERRLDELRAGQDAELLEDGRDEGEIPVLTEGYSYETYEVDRPVEMRLEASASRRFDQWLLDPAALTRYRTDEPFEPIARASAEDVFEVSWTVELETGIYHLLFDNTDTGTAETAAETVVVDATLVTEVL